MKFKIIKTYRNHSDELCYVIELNGREMVVNSRLILKLRAQEQI